MRKGKYVSQGCHASLGSYLEASSVESNKWIQNGQKKICLGIDSEEELIEIFKTAYNADLPCYLVKDAGHTQLEPGTYTAVGIGPASEEEINKITGKLKLL